MDVVDSSNHAIKNLQICLNKYPKSLSCHFTSVYLYLSSGSDGLYKAEESLIFLRKYFAPKLNSAVESAYVTLYLHKRDAKNAKIQIEKFIDIFPNHQYAVLYKDILPTLDNGIDIHECKCLTVKRRKPNSKCQ
jgi:outer membrane protein assembly factor BamD (BamD/ComL family)